ncbi:AI-2E family transporter [Corynebacterium sp. 335C]
MGHNRRVTDNDKRDDDARRSPEEQRDLIDRVVGSEPIRIEQSLSVPADDHAQDTSRADLPKDGDELHELMKETDSETIDRADVIGEGARWFAGWCLRFLIAAAALYVGWWVLSKIWAGLLPVLLALIVCTVLWVPTRWLRKLKFPNALASATAMILAFGIVGGIFYLMWPVVRDQIPTLADQFSAGISHLQTFLQERMNFSQDVSIDLSKITDWLQQRSSEIASSVFTGVSAVTSVGVTLVVTLVLTFFFLKDGDSFLPWLRGITGRRLGWHLTEVLTRSWNTLSGFIRTQAIVSFIDALLIGIGLYFLDVPLAFVLAVITFFAGFIPMIGAFTAGFIAVVIALVANGLGNGIAVLVLIVVVQQVEGNVLQPFLQSKAMELHAAIVLLAVTVGSTLFGIIGAFLAVPVAAVIAVWLRYLGDLTDLRTGDKTASDIGFATEAGSMSGMQMEAVAKAMRERLVSLRRGAGASAAAPSAHPVEASDGRTSSGDATPADPARGESGGRGFLGRVTGMVTGRGDREGRD